MSTDEYALLVGNLARRLRRDGFDQLLRRASFANLSEVWGLERSGFELMDVGVTFARPVTGRVDAPAPDDLLIRPSTDADIREIAAVMVVQPWGSRYEADPAYDPADVRELRARWLWNSHGGRADVVLVGLLEGRPAGYVTCRVDRHTGHGDIELVGTLPEFRGRRVAPRIMAHALAWFSTRATLITVRTQATNIAAANLYERAGFTLHASDMTFRLDLSRFDRVAS
jgi:ribosomal protein S18 acetylase RimI-like enzyme